MKAFRKPLKNAVLGLATLSILTTSSVTHAECSKSEGRQYVEDWFYARGACLLAEDGTSRIEGFLTGAGEALLTSTLEAVIPGVGILFSLGGGGDSQTAWQAEMIALLRSEFMQTNVHIEEFYRWARAQQNAELEGSFNALVNRVADWTPLSMQDKRTLIDTASQIDADLELLRQSVSLNTPARERLRWLHSYLTVVDMQLFMAAELSAVTVFARTEMELTPEQQMVAAADVDAITRGRWSTILLTGANAVFPYLEQVGSTFEEVARERLPGELTQCVGTVPPNWQYTLDQSEDGLGCRNSEGAPIGPNCGVRPSVGRSQGGPCDSFSLLSGDVDHYVASYDGSTFGSAESATNFHRWLIEGDMLVDGWGPVRRKMDLLWRLLQQPGTRPYTSADSAMDLFLYGQRPVLRVDSTIRAYGSDWGQPTELAKTIAEVFYNCLQSPPNYDDQGDQAGLLVRKDMSVAIGYAVEHGIEGINEICSAYMDAQAASGEGWHPYEFYMDGMLTNLDFRAYFQANPGGGERL